MKQNPLLATIEAKHATEIRYARLHMRQETADCATAALKRAFGFGPERNKKFFDALNAVIEENAEDLPQDGSDAFEEELKQACGKYYAPREVRYDFTR